MRMPFASVLAAAWIQAVPQVSCVAPAPAGTLVAFGLRDARIEVRDVRSGERKALFASAGRVERLAWCGSRLLSTVVNSWESSRSVDYVRGSTTLESWDLAGAEPVASRLLAETGVGSAQIVSPDGTRVLVTRSDRKAWILDAARLQDLAVVDGEFESGCWSTDGQRALLGGSDGRIAVVDVLRGRVERTVLTDLRAIRCLAMDPRGQVVIAGGHDQLAQVYDVRDWTVRAAWRSNVRFPEDWHGFEDIVLSPDGDTAFLTTSGRLSVQSWSLRTNTCNWRHDFDGGDFQPVQMTLSPDGRRLSSKRSNHPIHVFDTSDGKPIAAYAIQDACCGPQALDWTADGTILVACTPGDAGVTLFEGESLRPMHALTLTDWGLRVREFDRSR
jgi:WD40 repeat protein